MPTLKNAVALIASERADALRMPMALEKAFHTLVANDGLQLAAKLWAVRPEEVAVMVLKSAGRKVPRDWLSPERATGRFSSRERLLETVWMMWGNKRLVSEISRHVEIPTSAVSQILEAAEGRPEGFEVEPHHRGAVRRGLKHG